MILWKKKAKASQCKSAPVLIHLLSTSKPFMMSSENILKMDVPDILFKNRNQEYGAYILRKFYPNRVKASLLILFSMVLLFSALTFIPKNKIPEVPVIETTMVSFHEAAVERKRETPKAKALQIEKKVLQKKILSKLIITHSKDSTELFPDISNLTIGSKAILFGSEGPGIIDPGSIKTGIGAVAPKGALNLPVNKGPFENPDVQASFPGGEYEPIRYLKKNLRMPDLLAAEQMVQVSIKFVVGFDGNLGRFDVVRDGGAEFNSEVVRVLKKMPKWNAGKMGGQNVPVYYTLPVKFSAIE